MYNPITMLAETVTASKCIHHHHAYTSPNPAWPSGILRMKLQAILRMRNAWSSSRWPWLPEQAIAKLQSQCHTALTLQCREGVYLANYYVARFANAYMAFMVQSSEGLGHEEVASTPSHNSSNI